MNGVDILLGRIDRQRSELRRLKERRASMVADILLGRIDRQRSELRRLKERRASMVARNLELEAENERLRSRIMTMTGHPDETTFCNCSTCSRMRKEGWV